MISTCQATTLCSTGARIFDLTVASIDVIGPQQLATEELAIHLLYSSKIDQHQD